jgi:hypothetical protein
MRKLVYLGWLIVFLPGLVFAQEKVEAPAWNVGDKWVFDREGPMEVTGRDPRYYAVQFSGGIFRKDASGIALFERSNFNVKYMLEGDQRKEYWDLRKKVLNFPLTLGKQWKYLYQRDEYTTGLSQSTGGIVAVEYQETFQVLGWEEVQVRAGKFKAIKLEYKIKPSWRERFGPVVGIESKAWYWYSPEVKNFVKCQHEKGYQETLIKEKGARADWELASYELKK